MDVSRLARIQQNDRARTLTSAARVDRKRATTHVARRNRRDRRTRIEKANVRLKNHGRCRIVLNPKFGSPSGAFRASHDGLTQRLDDRQKYADKIVAVRVCLREDGRYGDRDKGYGCTDSPCRSSLHSLLRQVGDGRGSAEFQTKAEVFWLLRSEGMTTDKQAQPSIAKMVERLNAVLGSVEQFNNIEILPLVKGLLSPTSKEDCYIATYYRAVANVRTLLTLTDTQHFQAISMIARSLFELAVDMRLLQCVSDGCEKSLTFARLERLRAAKKLVAFAAKSSSVKDLSIFEEFIAKNEATLASEKQKLWPEVKRLDHWSAMDLRERVELISGQLEEIYNSDYPRLSWSTHAGLTGVINLEAETFTAMCGVALHIAQSCFVEVLRVIAKELKIDKAVHMIDEKFKFALHVPMTDTKEEAEQLRIEIFR